MRPRPDRGATLPAHLEVAQPFLDAIAALLAEAVLQAIRNKQQQRPKQRPRPVVLQTAEPV